MIECLANYYCDGCHKKLSKKDLSLGEIEEKFTKEEWQWSDQKTYCPDCAKHIVKTIKSSDVYDYIEQVDVLFKKKEELIKEFNWLNTKYIKKFGFHKWQKIKYKDKDLTIECVVSPELGFFSLQTLDNQGNFFLIRPEDLKNVVKL